MSVIPNGTQVKVKADGHSGLNGTVISNLNNEDGVLCYIIQLLDGSRIILENYCVEI